MLTLGLYISYVTQLFFCSTLNLVVKLNQKDLLLGPFFFGV